MLLLLYLQRLDMYHDHVRTLSARTASLARSPCRNAACGKRDLETGDPWRTDTLHAVQSMTKSVVAAAFMTLVEDGKASLDDPVSKYIPGFGQKVFVGGTAEAPETEPVANPVTVRHLMVRRFSTAAISGQSVFRCPHLSELQSFFGCRPTRLACRTPS